MTYTISQSKASVMDAVEIIAESLREAMARYKCMEHLWTTHGCYVRQEDGESGLYDSRENCLIEP